jgi:two-component system chemotaxis response regulator CheB
MRELERLVRVLIADDSDIAAAFLEQLLEEDPSIRVVGRVKNGRELIASPLCTPAHVLLVDALMPEVGGLSAIKRLSGKKPIIVVSSVEPDSGVAAECVALGATAFFSKRKLPQQAEAARLREAVKRAAGGAPAPSATQELLFVVGSTGAISHLDALIGALAGLEVSITVVQHLPPGKDSLLAELLRGKGMSARLARDGDALEPGVLIAPVGVHLEVDLRQRVHLRAGPAVNGHAPSGNVLLRSVVPHARRATAVMLSGLGDDGAEAMAELAESGGRCIALDPADCHAGFMPRAALLASPKIRAVRASELGSVVRQVLLGG